MLNFNEKHDDCSEFSYFGSSDHEELMDSFNESMENCNMYQRLYRGDVVELSEYINEELAVLLAEYRVGGSIYGEDGDKVKRYYEENLQQLLKDIHNVKFYYICNYKGEAEGPEIMIEQEALELPEYAG